MEDSDDRGRVTAQRVHLRSSLIFPLTASSEGNMARHMTVLLNFFADLRRRVPAAK
jgi:hypothetical protein